MNFLVCKIVRHRKVTQFSWNIITISIFIIKDVC